MKASRAAAKAAKNLEELVIVVADLCDVIEAQGKQLERIEAKLNRALTPKTTGAKKLDDAIEAHVDRKA